VVNVVRDNQVTNPVETESTWERFVFRKIWQGTEHLCNFYRGLEVFFRFRSQNRTPLGHASSINDLQMWHVIYNNCPENVVGTPQVSSKVSVSWVDPLLVQLISVPLFQLTILKFRQVWLSRMIPLVPHGRENWPVIVLFLFSGPAQQLDWCRVSYDSRGEIGGAVVG
jgi:hypothetical protein